MKKLILSILVIISFSSELFSQKISQVSTDKEMLHYQKFPASEDLSWFELEGMLQARFTFNGKDKIVIYSDHMKIIQEWTEMSFVPVSVDMHISSEFDSPKIKAIYEVEDNRNKTSFYSALVKVKGEGTNMYAYNKITEAIDGFSMLAYIE